MPHCKCMHLLNIYYILSISKDLLVWRALVQNRPKGLNGIERVRHAHIQHTATYPSIHWCSGEAPAIKKLMSLRSSSSSLCFVEVCWKRWISFQIQSRQSRAERYTEQNRTHPSGPHPAAGLTETELDHTSHHQTSAMHTVESV